MEEIRPEFERTARICNSFENTKSILTFPYKTKYNKVTEITHTILQDSTILDATLQVITVSNTSCHFHRINTQFVSKSRLSLL